MLSAVLVKRLIGCVLFVSFVNITVTSQYYDAIFEQPHVINLPLDYLSSQTGDQ